MSKPSWSYSQLICTKVTITILVNGYQLRFGGCVTSSDDWWKFLSHFVVVVIVDVVVVVVALVVVVGFLWCRVLYHCCLRFYVLHGLRIVNVYGVSPSCIMVVYGIILYGYLW